MKYKIVQKKKFNRKNLLKDQAMLYELYALVGHWNHYKDEKYQKGFNVINRYGGIADNGKGKNFSDKWQDKDYREEGFTRARTSVKVVNYAFTNRTLYIYLTGNCTITDHTQIMSPELMQIYIKYGYYKIIKN